MSEYQLESVVNEHGMIVLPDEMKNLHKHRVKIVITDLGTEISEPCDFLDHITKKYVKIEEGDIVIEGMRGLDPGTSYQRTDKRRFYK
jgi:hypothetical protein